MKYYKVLSCLLCALWLSGCASTQLLVSGWGPNPRVEYSAEDNEIIIHVSTYGANLLAVKNLVTISAAIVANKQRNCNYLKLTEAGWPNNIVARLIEINTNIVYRCSISKPTNQGEIVDVDMVLKRDIEKVDLIRRESVLVQSPTLDNNRQSSQKKSQTQVSKERVATSTRPKSRLSAYDSDTVREVQTSLKSRGYATGKIDGMWGDGSRRALKKFQHDSGLMITGELDTETLNALGISSESSIVTDRAPSIANTREAESNKENDNSVFTNSEMAVPEAASPKSSELIGEARIVKMKTDLLMDPDPFAEVLLEISAGTKVKLISATEDWAEIEVNEIRGYIDVSSLRE